MNMAANMLGLGNAATPIGLRAMRDLEELNPHPGTAIATLRRDGRDHGGEAVAEIANFS